jgi:hypothetical protein
MGLYIGVDCQKVYSPTLSPSELNSARVVRDVRANPLLLLLRLCVEGAFVDAQRCRDGVPTPEAIEATAWIEADLDWTARRGPIPPAAIRAEIIFSFCWCCNLLGLDVEDIRQNGLRRLSGFSHRSDVLLLGLDGIKQHWQKAREEHEARQLLESAVEATGNEPTMQLEQNHHLDG